MVVGVALGFFDTPLPVVHVNYQVVSPYSTTQNSLRSIPQMIIISAPNINKAPPLILGLLLDPRLSYCILLAITVYLTGRPPTLTHTLYTVHTLILLVLLHKLQKLEVGRGQSKRRAASSSISEFWFQ